MFLWFSESINVVLAIAEWARGAPHSIKQSFAAAVTNLISHCYRPTTATNLNEKKERRNPPHPACKPQHHIPPFQVNNVTINGYLLWALLECICEYKSISEVNVNNCNRQGGVAGGCHLYFVTSRNPQKKLLKSHQRRNFFSSCSINLGKIPLQLINTEVPIRLIYLMYNRYLERPRACDYYRYCNPLTPSLWFRVNFCS